MSSSRFPAVIDEVSVRLVAALVLTIGVIALATAQWWLYAVLAADFTLRACLGPGASPLAAVVRRWIRPSVNAPKSPTAGAPKRFAAAVGAVLTVTATALWVLHLATGAPVALDAVVGIGVVMVLFPALESILGLCVGCVAFSWLIRVGLVPEEVCLECADIRRRAQVRAVA